MAEFSNAFDNAFNSVNDVLVESTLVSASFDMLRPRILIVPDSIFDNKCYQKPYFNHLNSPCYENEKKMFSNMATEMWNQHGVKLEYYKTDYNTDYDRIYGEDRDRHILRTFPVQAYFELPNEDELVTVFGMEMKDRFKMYISKQHFSVASTLGNTGCGINSFDKFDPCVGDIIKGKWNNRFYEIIEVKDSEGVIMESKFIWTITVKTYRDNHLTTNTFTPPIPPVQQKQYDIESVTDKPIDILQINEALDSEKDEYIYEPKPLEDTPDNDDLPPVNDNPFGQW